MLFWLALAACGSVMLLATTNQLCQEVPSVPFLWVLPLALYLITFIICFDHERWYHRDMFLVLLAAGRVLAACYALYQGTALQHVAAIGDLLGHAVGLLHGLSRRAGASKPGAAVCHAVLPDGVGRRCAGRHAGGHRRAAGAAAIFGSIRSG